MNDSPCHTDTSKTFATYEFLQEVSGFYELIISPSDVQKEPANRFLPFFLTAMTIQLE